MIVASDHLSWDYRATGGHRTPPWRVYGTIAVNNRLHIAEYVMARDAWRVVDYRSRLAWWIGCGSLCSDDALGPGWVATHYLGPAVRAVIGISAHPSTHSAEAREP